MSTTPPRTDGRARDRAWRRPIGPILLLAAAAGTAVAVDQVIGSIERLLGSMGESLSFDRALNVRIGAEAAVLAIGLLVLRLSERRIDRPDLLRLPGFGAGLAIATTAVLPFLSAQPAWIDDYLGRSGFPGTAIPFSLIENHCAPADAAQTVVVVWSIQAIGGRWLRPSDWTEWLGIGLGLACLATAAFRQYLAFHAHP